MTPERNRACALVELMVSKGTNSKPTATWMNLKLQTVSRHSIKQKQTNKKKQTAFQELTRVSRPVWERGRKSTISAESILGMTCGKRGGEREVVGRGQEAAL